MKYDFNIDYHLYIIENIHRYLLTKIYTGIKIISI